ncbi:MAG: DUF3160 domain-containing protein [candidate division WOR-3 bacterium]|nr:MAG: DUF3160 domain-containing protein [candidate division WOR-3 bacterium]
MQPYSLILLLTLLSCPVPMKEGSLTIKPEKIEPQELYDSFSSAERDILLKYGFFAQKSTHKKFSDLYKSLKDRNLPIYITTDCVLHSYHILYDYSLRMLEMNYLYEEVRSLTETMIARTQELARDAPGDIEAALLDNLAYFEIAAKLMDPHFAVSTSRERVVREEVNLINKAEGFAVSPLFGHKEDYTQYKPRGHYTRNEILQKYFRAMMWYGRMTFRLKPDQRDEGNKKGKHQTRQALLILEAAQDYFDQWEKINTPILLYVGKSDDLTLLEYFEIKNRDFPGETPLQIASNDRKLTEFIDEALKARVPKITSDAVLDIEEPAIITKGLRFFGQKFIPDSYIFQNLVYDKVGTRMNPRLFPKGLDVLAVLGSNRAREILIERYNEHAYLNYETQMEKLRHEFKELSEADWRFNLYWGWLYTLKSLIIPVPQFHAAYQDKCLQTALGSWAELRHDTILYAKQSYTAEITAIRPKPELVRGYVEPIPECYKRLKQLVDMSRTELEQQAFLDETVELKFIEFSRLLENLERIAQSEIENKTLTEDDYRFIQHIGSALEGIETFPAAAYTTETDERAALIADVHTDINTKQVLEVGNDVPALLYTVVEMNGTQQLFIGGVYDYYEFLQPMGERLTDEEWQKLSPKPAKPDWIEFFVR